MRRGRMAAAKVMLNRTGTAATVRRVVQAAAVVFSTGTQAPRVEHSIRLDHTIARRATRAIGAATGIGIRSDIRLATNVTARTTVATVSRIVFVRSVAAAIAAAVRGRVPIAARSAAVGRVVTTITTSIPGRPLLRRRTRTTRYVGRGIFCWIIRLRLGRIELGAGSRELGVRSLVSAARKGGAHMKTI